MKSIKSSISLFVMVFFAFNTMANERCNPDKPALPASCLTEQYAMAVAWYQNSAEAKAAFYQGYQLGKYRLAEALKSTSGKPLAVVLDLDETVLDDSPHQAWLVKNQGFLLDRWDEWVDMAVAEAVPGAKEFLDFADKNGVSIFYLSDRKSSQTDVTLQNLQKLSLPQADKNHLLLKTADMKTKQGRRDRLEAKYNVVLYFGDNLADFLDSKGKTQEERNKMMEDSRAEFGQRFIIFPNPMYGDWYGAIINNDIKQDYNTLYKLRSSRLTPFVSQEKP